MCFGQSHTIIAHTRTVDDARRNNPRTQDNSSTLRFEAVAWLHVLLLVLNLQQVQVETENMFRSEGTEWVRHCCTSVHDPTRREGHCRRTRLRMRQRLSSLHNEPYFISILAPWSPYYLPRLPQIIDCQKMAMVPANFS